MMRTIALYTTSECPRRCKWCCNNVFRNAFPDYHASLEEVDLLCEKVPKPVSRLILTGGEPLIWDNLVEGLKRLRQSGKFPCILLFTGQANPELLTDEVVSLTNYVRISSYPSNREVARKQAQRHRKVVVVDKGTFYESPTEPVPGSRPGLCACPEFFYFQGKMFACPNVLNHLTRFNVPWSDYPEAWTEMCSDYESKLSNYKHGNARFCDRCIANKKTRHHIRSQVHEDPKGPKNDT